MGRGAAAAAAPRRSAPGRHRSARGRFGSAAAASPARGRRRSGHATRVDAQRASAVALPLPVRILNAPFSRTARARTNGVLDALLTGRGWIALVFLLLAGIVFFNVDLLQMNKEIAVNADKAATIGRENARLRTDLARLGSSERIQRVAAQAGLVMPAPGEVRYLTASPKADARRALQRVNAKTAPAPAAAEPEPAAPQPAAPLPAAPQQVAQPQQPQVEQPVPATPAQPVPQQPASPQAQAPPTTGPTG